jgi:hypothetical protein
VSDAERRRRLVRWRWAIRFWGPVWARDVWLLVVTVLVVVALAHQQSAIDRQREGRRTAIEAVCGVEQATIDAGRARLLGGAHLKPERFARNLERLGYPPQGVRERGARAAAQAYSTQIAKAVEHESGVRGIVGPDGRLNCGRLVSASAAR